MKKHLLIAAGLLTATIIQTQPATAVTKCVALNSTTTECSGISHNGSEWSATCTTNGITTTIRGIGVCSSTPNQSGYTVASIEYSTNPSENKECWCRMISPAVSQWVHYFNPNTSAEYCAEMCSTVCTNYLYNSSYFRGSFFKSMTD